jgi:hypothetical protein
VHLEGATRPPGILLIHTIALWSFDSVRPGTLAAVENVDDSFIVSTMGANRAHRMISAGIRKGNGADGIRWP